MALYNSASVLILFRPAEIAEIDFLYVDTRDCYCCCCGCCCLQPRIRDSLTRENKTVSKNKQEHLPWETLNAHHMCVGRMFAIVVTSASPTQCRLTSTTQRHSDKATQQHCHQPELIENIVIHERKHGNIMLHVTISHFLHVSTPFFSSHRM